MFRHEVFLERSQGLVAFEQFSHRTLTMIVDFIYTDDIDREYLAGFNESEELLQAAKYFQLDRLSQVPLLS